MYIISKIEFRPLKVSTGIVVELDFYPFIFLTDLKEDSTKYIVLNWISLILKNECEGCSSKII